MSDKKVDQIVKDDELDELLDSALEDFDTVATKNEASSSSSKKKSDDEVEDPPMETLWNDEFIAQQAKMFEKQMGDIFGAGDKEVTPEQLNLGFQRIAEAAALAVDPNSSQLPQVDPAFTQSISDVLKGLSEGQENLQQPFSTDDIAGMFGNVNLNESGDNNAFLPFMQGMMQSLLSAEVLLPSLKEIVTKYPAWLAENGSKITADEKERYENQLKLMQEVCGELEKEKANDSAEVKKERFNIVLDRMQKMQELGQPPSDLVGDGAENVIPNLADGSLPTGDQCSIM
ncbi:CLUMA_CG014477, isoform A [Clunio marinus]|uniref:Peroxin-19 n=1 Tax=Clunio marinus TaxID=568069 RepID=A0A1J1IP15_9DIPT|nr:CLUMA_CG014477, isoform A [Clunio marinus]